MDTNRSMQLAMQTNATPESTAYERLNGFVFRTRLYRAPVYELNAAADYDGTLFGR